MRKLTLAILIFTAVVTAHAQKWFELDVTTKMGYYFPVEVGSTQSLYFPENAFSPAVGISFGYNLFKSTGVFLGMEYSYLSPELIDHFEKELNVTWQSVNVPFNIEQGIGKNFFLTGGVTLICQLKGYWEGIGSNSVIPVQKIPEYNWQAGVGYKLKDLRVSLRYYRGFKNIDKYTSTGENSWFGVDVKHQEFFVKLEYPLWKF